MIKNLMIKNFNIKGFHQKIWFLRGRGSRKNQKTGRVALKGGLAVSKFNRGLSKKEGVVFLRGWYPNVQ